MIERIITTTDGKYIGDLIDTTIQPITSSDGVVFDVAKMQDLGGGKWRYSSSNYVVETKEVTDGENNK